jgi:hypothetical protein
MITIGDNSDYGSLGQNTCVLYDTGQGQTPDGPPPTLPQTSPTSASTVESTTTAQMISLPVVTLPAPISLTIDATSTPTLSSAAVTTFGLPMPTVAMPIATHKSDGPNDQGDSSIAANGPGSSVRAIQGGSSSVAATTRVAGAQNGVSESSYRGHLQWLQSNLSMRPWPADPAVIPATVETLVRTAGGVTFTSVYGGFPTTITAADGRVMTSTLGGVTSFSVSGGTLTTAIVTRSARTIARVSSTATQVSGGYKVVGKVSSGTIALTVIPLLAGLAGLACV